MSPKVNNDGLSMRSTVFESLSSSNFYYGFIQHLSREMSVECLLSVTEFVQFREWVKETTNDYVEKEDSDDQFSVQLPSNIPKSWIVANEEWNSKQKAYELIRNCGEFKENVTFYLSIIARFGIGTVDISDKY